jgi:hypothetical protein
MEKRPLQVKIQTVSLTLTLAESRPSSLHVLISLPDITDIADDDASQGASSCVKNASNG